MPEAFPGAGHDERNDLPRADVQLQIADEAQPRPVADVDDLLAF